MSDNFFDPIAFDDSEAVEFDNSPAPDGDYTLQVENFKSGTSQAGNAKIDWEFKVVENEDGQNAKRVWHTTVTSGRGAGMFTAVISALGYNMDEWLGAQGGSITYEGMAGLIGERVEARLRTDTPDEATLDKYPNAKPRNKIARFV